MGAHIPLVQEHQWRCNVLFKRLLHKKRVTRPAFAAASASPPTNNPLIKPARPTTSHRRAHRGASPRPQVSVVRKPSLRERGTWPSPYSWGWDRDGGEDDMPTATMGVANTGSTHWGGVQRRAVRICRRIRLHARGR